MNRLRWLIALLMLSLGCWLTGIAPAADDKKDGKDESNSAKTFAKKASAAGLAEVNLSQLAVRFSRNPAVRQFAQRMVEDHTKANGELTTLANRKSIALAERMDEKHQKKFNELSKMSGSEFDAAFMQCMVMDHEEAVKLFESASKNCDDKDLKAWAGNTLPTLKEHLEMARGVAKKANPDKKEKSKDRSDK